MDYLLLHNPQCSKSRAALKLLQDKGVAFQVREYLKEPLSLDELRILKQRLGREPTEWIRWNEGDAKEAGIEKGGATMELLQAIATYPRLMERPILVHGDEAQVGRPGPEALERLL